MGVSNRSLRVSAWGKGSGTCLSPVSALKKRREKKKTTVLVGAWMLVWMPHWILRKNIGISVPLEQQIFLL